MLYTYNSAENTLSSRINNLLSESENVTENAIFIEEKLNENEHNNSGIDNAELGDNENGKTKDNESYEKEKSPLVKCFGKYSKQVRAEKGNEQKEEGEENNADGVGKREEGNEKMRKVEEKEEGGEKKELEDEIIKS
ncbi:hypothetical protein PMALA_045000 [Plasmodium malariae]|uniref:Uncharacterized protein n=1 Tax=Plasmodium malariae TaxID=5858 RepID=A0A1A8WPK8_PLAMA|nr:hypothetical protein PMALA_045000 [Plasmodium malariae]